MIGRASSFLGLSFSDRGIACAEVSSGDRRVVRHMATFPFTAELSLDKPDAMGMALAAFLREKKFASSRVVAGVPARWLIASEKDIPPANEQQARSLLTIQAERSSGDGNEMVFDFAGKPNSHLPSRVLLVGIVKQQFDRVSKVLDVAGLNVIAITSTGLTLAGNLQKENGDAALLFVGPYGAEMVVRCEGTTRTLRHVSMTPNGQGTPAIGPLGAELRRAMAVSAAGGGAPPSQMLLLDGVGLKPEQVSELATRSGLQLTRSDELKLLGVTTDAAATARLSGEEPVPLSVYATAVSLALSANKSDALPLDFLHSRLAPQKKARLGRTAVLGIAAAALVLAGIVYLYVQLNKSQHELDTITARLASMDKQATDAQKIVDRVAYARVYYDLRPNELECLRQFTLMFHDDEKIWVTNFTLKDDGKGSLLGKAADQETAMKMIERLKKNAKFTSLEHLDVHEADTRTHEWQYSFNFTYNYEG